MSDFFVYGYIAEQEIRDETWESVNMRVYR